MKRLTVKVEAGSDANLFGSTKYKNNLIVVESDTRDDIRNKMHEKLLKFHKLGKKNVYLDLISFK